jgi:hypothetical protein
MFLGNRARPALKANNLTAICEPTVNILNISQPYGPPRPVTGITSLFCLPENRLCCSMLRCFVIFSSPRSPHWLLGTPSLVSDGYRDLKLPTHLQRRVFPQRGISTSVLPYAFMAWCLISLAPGQLHKTWACRSGSYKVRASCGPYMNRSFVRINYFHLHGRKSAEL